MTLVVGNSALSRGTTTCPSSEEYDFLPSDNAKLAIGTKKMIESYEGPLFRFRKSTGGSEFDVEYGEYGYPDVTTANTDLGADAGYFVRVYDNLELYDAYWTASTAPQPRLAMAKGDSRKAVQVAHIASQYMQCDLPISAGETWTLYLAWTPNEMGGSMVLSGGTGTTRKWFIYTHVSNKIFLDDNSGVTIGTSDYSITQRAPQIMSVQFKTNGLRVRVNGELVLSHNTWTVQASALMQIARRNDGGGAIGQFNWNGIYAHAGEYDSEINTTMCNMFLR